MDLDPTMVFASNGLDLGQISVYGFDYDFTLARYKRTMNELIYKLARKVLVEKLKYPKEINDFEYDDDFAIRGLHYDTVNGILLKVDQFQKIQVSSVYRGMKQLTEDEVKKIYGVNLSIPAYMLRGGFTGESSIGYKPWKAANMVQLADAFAKSQMCLLSQIKHLMLVRNMTFHPKMLFDDVNKAVQGVHAEMHHVVGGETEKYIDSSSPLRDFLLWLRKSGKETFLLTNSPFDFVNRGMSFLVGRDWRELFDVTVFSASKPLFFLTTTRPFRFFDPSTGTVSWDRVGQLRKNQIYTEGNCAALQELTGWNGTNTLYFGDHPYSDLADLSLQNLWNTAAVVQELSDEIKIFNDVKFKETFNWLLVLAQFIDETQDECFKFGSEGCSVLQEWKAEERKLRTFAKQAFNKQFGSVFRTDTNPTYFSRRLFRYASIYTADVTNLMNFSPQHTFYPRRGALPHEYKYLFI